MISIPNKLDAMASAYGKTSDKGQQLLRLRSDIRRGSNPPAPTANPVIPSKTGDLGF